MHRTFYGRNLIAVGVWFGRYNEGVLSEKARACRSMLMKFRSLLLSLILVAGVSLSSTSFAQADKPTTQTPATGQAQQPAATQPSTTQPADQKPAATDQSQIPRQPIADQDQPAAPFLGPLDERSHGRTVARASLSSLDHGPRPHTRVLGAPEPDPGGVR